jgi:hypothetical protein
LERAGRVGLIAGLLILLVGGGFAAWRLRRQGTGADRPLPIPGEGGERVTVEVVNHTGADGLAREVARRLRRAGIDVVGYGSAQDSTADTTTIVIRRGDSTAAIRVRQALGLGRIRVDPDPRLLLDASVLVGPDLARALGFHP